MEDRRQHPRFAKTRLLEALSESPVVLIHGPRQAGKTTLARTVGEPRGFAYLNFDDAATLAAAQADPAGFVADLPERAILDEVQRVPELFPAIKGAVDRRRVPGRFLLTGSANVLLLPKLSESLAGRVALLRLHPLAQCELAGEPSRFLETMFDASFRLRTSERLGSALLERLVAGGFPAALARTSPRGRAAWYRDYVETMVQRDARNMTRIRSLDALPRLLELAAGHSARLLNATELSGPLNLTRPTIQDYLTVLERMFLIEPVSPWHVNRMSRLVKTPKLHVVDTGMACALLGLDATALGKDRGMFGQLLETFVLQELRRQASWHEEDVRFHHYRDRDRYEVDVVLERRGHDVAGVEVKAAATVTEADFRGLRRLKDAARQRFRTGVVLYDGETCLPFGDGFFAVPIRLLWELR